MEVLVAFGPLNYYRSDNILLPFYLVNVSDYSHV